MMTRILSVLALTVALVPAAVAAPTTYYVSPSGNDSSPGSSNQPWRTIDRVNAGTFNGGDRIFFLGGQSFPGTLRLSAARVRTVANAPLLIGSYGAGRATISSGTETGATITGIGGVRISNIDFAGSSAAAGIHSSSGIVITNNGTKVSGITIDHSDIGGYGFAGIYMTGADRDSGFDQTTLEYLQVHDSSYAGIVAIGDAVGTFRNTTVQHNEIYRITGYKTAYGTGVDQSGSGIILNGLLSAVVADNRIHDNGLDGGSPYAIAIASARTVAVQENESYLNHTSSTSGGGGIDFGGTITEGRISYNYSHQNEGPAVRVCACALISASTLDVGVRYNISENDGGANAQPSILFSGGGQPADQVEIFNNTIFRKGPNGSAIGVQNGGGARVRFVNNLTITDNNVAAVEIGDQSSFGSLTFSNNAYFAPSGAPLFRANACSFCDPATSGTTYSGVAAWSAATGQEAGNSAVTGSDPAMYDPGHGGTLNPRRLSDLNAYRLFPQSTLVDRGANLATLGIDSGGRDFYGYMVPSATGYDIGAHELTLVAVAPTLEPIADQVVSVGETRSIEVIAHDPDGDSLLTLTLSSPTPDVRLVDAAHGRGTIIVSPSHAYATSIRATLTARDASGEEVSRTFEIHVTSSGDTSRPRAFRPH
jgi:hypothetical protein